MNSTTPIIKATVTNKYGWTVSIVHGNVCYNENGSSTCLLHAMSDISQACNRAAKATGIAADDLPAYITWVDE